MSLPTMPSVRVSEDTLHAIENALDEDRMKAVFAAQMKQRFGKNLQVNGFH
jgi:tetrahydromethanopterin S-methyltransferase subunit G